MAAPPIPDTEETGPITMEQVIAFAAASGDSNPIHLSTDAARAAGLEGTVLHGMFIAGRFETFLERMNDHEVAELHVRFVRPVPVGCGLTISARLIEASQSGLHLRLLAHVQGGALAAIGEARMKASGSPPRPHR